MPMSQPSGRGVQYGRLIFFFSSHVFAIFLLSWKIKREQKTKFISLQFGEFTLEIFHLEIILVFLLNRYQKNRIYFGTLFLKNVRVYKKLER